MCSMNVTLAAACTESAESWGAPVSDEDIGKYSTQEIVEEKIPKVRDARLQSTGYREQGQSDPFRLLFGSFL